MLKSKTYFLAKLFSPSIMTCQLYVAVIIEYKDETVEYLLRLQACLVRHWGGESTMLLSQQNRPSPTYTAPKLSHVDFSFSQSGPFHKALDIEQ